MSKNGDYIERYSVLAIEQMRKYGIPASVTLAQAILESGSGQSELARKENNHFGIKASKAWLEGGGRYALYSDDRPNEKFCSYDSVAESYEHHSRFLKENSRYAACFKLPANDYKGWAEELDRAGYATAGSYAPALLSIIERNGLDKYDRMAMEQMPTESIGKHYAFPVKRDEFLLVTSPFGLRTDPLDPTKEQMHKGIDIRTDYEAVSATEDGGKVMAVNNNPEEAGGKSVTIEYAQESGEKLQVTYRHLDSVTVHMGDTVKAGQQVGVSGSSLEIGVKQISQDGTIRDIDPAAYLAEVSQKGNIPLQLLHNGNDLLVKYKGQDGQSSALDTSLLPEQWMKKLLSSEDSGIGLSNGQDPVIEMAMTLFSSLLVLAQQIDQKSEEEQKAAATEAAKTKQMDLSSLAPAYRECTLTVRENGNPVLQVSDGNSRYTCPLSRSDMNRLNLVLSDSTLSNEAKQQRVSAVIQHIALTAQLSENYEQGVRPSQSEGIKY